MFSQRSLITRRTNFEAITNWRGMVDSSTEMRWSRGDGGSGGDGARSDARVDAMTTMGSTRPHRTRRHRSTRRTGATTAIYAVLAGSIPSVMAQNCISLADSTQCPAFSAGSVSTNTNLTGLFPFLSSVSDTSSFDIGLKAYVANGFAQLR